MNPQAPLITDEARAILDGAQHDCQIREVPSMTWGVMDRLEVEHPEVLEAEAATIGSADWRDNLKQAIDSPGWNSSWELHALISGVVASGRAQGVGCVGVGEVGRSAAALVGGEMRPVSDVDETAEAEPVQPGSFKVPSRFSGMIADPLSSTGSHRLEDVHEQLELMTRVEQALLRATSNKVVLVGDHGVGKTALVRQLAQRLRSGQAPLTAGGVGLVSATSLFSKAGGVNPRAVDPIRSLADQVAAAGGLLCVEGVGDPATRSQFSDTTALEVLAGAVADDSRPMLFTSETGCWAREASNAPTAASQFEVIHVDEMSTRSVEQVLMTLREVLAPEGQRPSEFIPRAVVRAVAAQARQAESGAYPGAAVRLLDRLAARAVHEKRRVTLPMLDDELGAKTTVFMDGTAEAVLGERVFGQDAAIAKIVNAIAMRESGLRPGYDRMVSLFLAGPTGVGKTETAHGIAGLISGDDTQVIRLDMAEYSSEGSVYKLTGAPPGLVGHSDGAPMWSPLQANPNCVVIFDEIEKAHPSVQQVLLGPMDSGRLTLANGQTLDLSRAVAIFTSNVDLTGGRRMGFGGDQGALDAAAQLTRHFAPEWVNRLDAICEFQPLSLEAVEGIVRSRLLPVTEERLKWRGMKLVVDPAVITHIAGLGHSERFGARELNRTYERELILPLSRAVPRRTRNATVSCQLVDGKVSVSIE
ncbi:MAG: hypothetical protein BGO90_02475 [Legionella sp. 40-6]|nr:MAG: hypothetical protein BGO90_02475 [Legionella sp. 40-6]